MNILRRLSAIFRAWLNARIGRLEDPSRMLTTALSDMKTQLHDVAGEVGRVVAEHKRMQKELARHEGEAAAWEKKAMQAISNGNDGAARVCLQRKETSDQQVQLLSPLVSTQSDLAEQMKGEARRMKARVDDAQAKKALLQSRQAAAQAQKTVLTGLARIQGRIPGNVMAAGTDSALGKLESAVVTAESALEAQAELSFDVDVERDFEALAIEALAIDPQGEDALAALRTKMALLAAPPLVEPEDVPEVGAEIEVDKGEEARLFSELPVAVA